MKLENPLLTKIVIFLIANLPLILGIVLIIYYNKLKHCLDEFNQNNPDIEHRKLDSVYPYVIAILSIACAISFLNIISLHSKIFFKNHHIKIILPTLILLIIYTFIYNVCIADINYYINSSDCNSKFKFAITYFNINIWVFYIMWGILLTIFILYVPGAFKLVYIIDSIFYWRYAYY